MPGRGATRGSGRTWHLDLRHHARWLPDCRPSGLKFQLWKVQFTNCFGTLQSSYSALAARASSSPQFQDPVREVVPETCSVTKSPAKPFVPMIFSSPRDGQRRESTHSKLPKLRTWVRFPSRVD